MTPGYAWHVGCCVVAIMRNLVFASLLLSVCASVAHAQRSWFSRPQPQQRVAVVLPYGVEIRNGDLRQVAAQERAALQSFVRNARGHGAAKQHILIQLPPGASIQTIEPGQYSKSPFVDKSQLIKLTGFSGDIQAIHLGTMSVHDLYNETTGAYNQALFDLRERDDRMALELDGRRVLNRVPSGLVAMNDVTIPKGTREIQYVRQDANGRTVGDRYGYTMGRVLRLSWDQ